MEIANGAKCFGGAVHGIPAERAVNVKIDKPRREIISVKVDNVFAAGSGLLACPSKPWRRRANFRDFPSFHDNFEAVANAIGRNQTRICEDHSSITLNVQRSTFNVKRSELRLDAVKSILFSAALNGSDRTVHTRWVIDATGRATMLARKLGHFRPNAEHPINAVWALVEM